MCDANFIGTTGFPTKVHNFTLSGIDGSHDVGDVLSAVIQLPCSTMTRAGLMRVFQINAYEKSPAGTQVKPALRIHFFKSTYTPPAIGAPFKGPSSGLYNQVVGYVDIASSDYLEYGDGSGTDPDYATAQKILTTGLTLQSNETVNANWCLVEIREAKTLAVGALIGIDIMTQKLS